MDSYLTTFVTLASTSAVLNLFLCAFVFLKRRDYGELASSFIMSAAATTIYAFGYAFSLTSSTLGQLKFWNVVQYIGMPFAPPLGLLFVMRYLGKRVPKRGMAALLVIPVLSLLIDATNDLHHLQYAVYETDPARGAPYVHIEYGIWFVIQGIFLFSCMLAAFLLLLARWKETTRPYRPQLLSLLCGQLAPMLTAFLYLVGIAPEGIDTVPMVVWISSAMFLWAIVSSHMLTIVPIAKETIFHSMNDGVLVLDGQDRLVEFNNEAKSMLEGLDRSMLGQPLGKVWAALFGTAFPFASPARSDNGELSLTVQGTERIYQSRVAALRRSGRQGEGRLLIFTDITELKRLQTRLEHLAYYDELTGIYNRRAFFERCRAGFAEARKEGEPTAVLLMDIDFFKKVNDTYGHDTGDRLLEHFVAVCRACLSEDAGLSEDMLFARYGGEEFVLALRGFSPEESVALANRVRERVAANPLLTAEGEIAVTSSIGISVSAGEQEETLRQLLQRADEALYAAKRSGRNRSVLHEGAATAPASSAQ
ncbi:histidine kinase N-terminal 7TM domain-containing diguanylate cyclase [Cohnella fermenti]|uniref:Diguanylate cyclase n=1 Tax=Cohnella fermenti TaxID=2565925 RepID=A0A4S4C2B5_9BACL|nr:histidine kinase N-terminal 7TM domain-containing protein [Cohnella fermenti]THF81649.1 diguanylate cyclase [Cohnella fermenti]